MNTQIINKCVYLHIIDVNIILRYSFCLCTIPSVIPTNKDMVSYMKKEVFVNSSIYKISEYVIHCNECILWHLRKQKHNKNKQVLAASIDHQPN